MTVQEITSSQNPRIKELVRLSAHKKERERSRQMRQNENKAYFSTPFLYVLHDHICTGAKASVREDAMDRGVGPAGPSAAT